MAPLSNLMTLDSLHLAGGKMTLVGNNTVGKVTSTRDRNSVLVLRQGKDGKGTTIGELQNYGKVLAEGNHNIKEATTEPASMVVSFGHPEDEAAFNAVILREASRSPYEVYLYKQVLDVVNPAVDKSKGKR